MKLNVGCGRDIRDGWVNVDKAALPGVDVLFDLDKAGQLYFATKLKEGAYQCESGVGQLPYEDSTFEEIYMSHILEHLCNPLAVMQELHRVAQPGAKCIIRVPYGATDNAWEDPTHVRPYFLNSFQYFSQVTYTRADYDYRGDWRVLKRTLVVDPAMLKYRDRLEDLFQLVIKGRNLVLEMQAILECVKPIRDPFCGEKEASPVQFNFGAPADGTYVTA